MKKDEKLQIGYNFKKCLQKSTKCDILTNHVCRKEEVALSDTVDEQLELKISISVLKQGEFIKLSVTAQPEYECVQTKNKEMDNSNNTASNTYTQEELPPIKLTQLNVDIYQAANYFIQLFIRTGKRYTCSRTKLGKLLSILAFTFAAEGKQLFVHDIYKYGDCGTTIPQLMKYEKEIYLVVEDNDTKSSNNKGVPRDSIDWVMPVVEPYNTIVLDNQVKNRILNVFLRFGNMSAKTLGTLMCSFIPNILTDNDVVDLLSFSDEGLYNLDQSDILLGYIYEFKGENR